MLRYNWSLSCNHVFLFYFLISSIMYARLRDIFELEVLKNRSELQAAVERYSSNRDSEMAQEASRIFRENYGINKSSSIIPPFKIHFPSYFVREQLFLNLFSPICLSPLSKSE
ncbi:hypothetical protein Y032_0040g197 [Ancylostoma ceylanicum]|uniref:Uncharacterized protein n=2 Tax=Ancylostoma ceylanicum TaxID=53326 RepID=A0A016UHS8_9BILA|nr:hypothetical protein Y032_0040g197 [Ancylostoma ceylanicum]